MNKTPSKLELLHPRYWGTWLGIGLLWLLVWLPHRLLLPASSTDGFPDIRSFPHRQAAKKSPFISVL